MRFLSSHTSHNSNSPRGPTRYWEEGPVVKIRSENGELNGSVKRADILVDWQYNLKSVRYYCLYSRNGDIPCKLKITSTF